MDLFYYLKFPFNDREWFKKIAIGCVVLLVPIVNILAIGYFVQCIKLGVQGRHMLPFWDDWGKLLQDGIIALIILCAYFLIPLILSPLFLSVPVIGIFMESTVFLITGLMVPIAIANYTITYDLQAAFKLGEILAQLSEVVNDYVIAYLMIILVSTIATALIFVLPVFALFAAIINFYISIIFCNFIGQLLGTITQR